MRRSGKALWVLLWLAVATVTAAAPARAAGRERVALIGVVVDDNAIDRALTEQLLARLRNEQETIVRGPDPLRRQSPGDDKTCDEPTCWEELAQKEQTKVAVVVKVKRQGGEARAFTVRVHDPERSWSRLRDGTTTMRNLPDRLGETVHLMLQEHRDAPPPVTPTTAPPSGGGLTGGAGFVGGTELPPAALSGGDAPADAGKADAPKTMSGRWQRASISKRFLVAGLGVAAIGALAGGIALAALDNKSTMGPCSYNADSTFRNCVTEYRGGYAVLFTAAPVLAGVSLYLVLKK